MGRTSLLLLLGLASCGATMPSSSSSSSSSSGKKCGGAPGAWGSNVSCPASALGCVPRKMGGDRRKWLDGYPWSCVMPSTASPGKNTTCATGAPYPLSTTKKVRALSRQLGMIVVGFPFVLG
eukprot:COSAG06_NODE_780_length_12362_cov_44.967142_13_plen_122_part_00